MENFQTFTFFRKISRFSSAKISDDLFFSHRPQISLAFYILYVFFVSHFPPTLTMMHLCITQCTYWMPLGEFTFKPAIGLTLICKYCMKDFNGQRSNSLLNYHLGLLGRKPPFIANDWRRQQSPKILAPAWLHCASGDRMLYVQWIKEITLLTESQGLLQF